MPVAVVNGPSAPAKPRTRFNQQTADRGICKPLRRGNAGCAAADYRDFDVIVGHG
jgi:hypothetical protein